MSDEHKRLSDFLQSPVFLDRLGKDIPGLVYVFDLIDRRNVFTNRPLANVLGYTPEQVRDMGVGMLPTIIHPDDLPMVLAHHARMETVGDGVTSELEFRVLAADGQVRWLHSWESVLRRDEHGRPHQVLGLAQDVTSRVRTEEELRESRRALAASEQRWRSIAENPFDFVVVIDRAYKYTFINFVAPGLRAEDLIGKATPLDFIAPEDHPRVVAAFEVAFREGRPTSYDVYIPPLDRWFSSLVGPIHEGDVVTHISILTRDTTEEQRARTQARQAEQQLRMMEAKLAQSAKLEAVGQLAGGIAHDFNNLLTGISGVAQLLAARLTPSDPSYQDLQDLLHTVARGTGLTRQLLTFSRQQPVTPTAIDVQALLEHVGPFLRRLIGENVDLQIAATERPLHVNCDRTQFEQVLLNLAVNARDAMPNGGRLTLSTAVVTIDEATSREHPDVQPGEFVQLTVADSGHGMDPVTLGRIFEPFFTTKPIGSGTGLGLSLVYGIIRRSGGFIQVRSAPGQGTTFSIHLPEAATPAATRAASSPAGRPRGSERIFLVEDEPLVLRQTQRMLETLGYVVETATRGDEALARLEAGARPDLLLTDVLLPGLDGGELCRRAAALVPGLRVVFMSGYTDNVLGDGTLARLGAAFLQKPFSFDELATKIRDSLDARRN